MLAACAAAGVVWAMWPRGMAWTAARGVELLSRAERPGDAVALLAQWEAETGPTWSQQPDAFTNFLLNRRPLDDARVRALVTFMSGCDYGPRLKDWDRWRRNRERLSEGRDPYAARGERVRLKREWVAPVGVTRPDSVILPIDGRVYVATRGRGSDVANDDADGVVVVDGGGAASAFLFQPPNGGDVVGIAAADGWLAVACRDGFVYAVNPDGGLRWSRSLAAPAASGPLIVDANQDGVSDVIVATDAGLLMMLSGHAGATAWKAELGTRDVEWRLAWRPFGQILAATREGQLIAVDTRRGAVRWRARLDGFGGAVGGVGPGEGVRVDYVGDWDGGVWVAPANEDTLMRLNTLRDRSGPAPVVGLRSVWAKDEARPWVLAATQNPQLERSSIAAVDGAGLRWRYAFAGAVYGPPAVADINGDGTAEIIVAVDRTRVPTRSAELAHGAADDDFQLMAADGATPGGAPPGVLMVLTADGHLLLEEPLRAAPTSSPVVGDADGDGKLDVLIADAFGDLTCFSTGVAGPIEWGLVAGDAGCRNEATTAYSWSQRPAGFQWGGTAKPDEDGGAE